MKKWLSLAILLLVLTLSLLIVFQNNDPATILAALTSLHPGWLWAAAGCYGGFLFFDGLGYYGYFRQHGHPIPLWYACYVALMGAFYSGITPSSSGGQPMQVYYLKKKSVPISVGTAGLCLRFALGQLSSVIVVPVLWFLFRQPLRQYITGVGWLVWIGWTVHLFGVLVILAATFFRPRVQRLADGLVHLGARLRLICDKAAAADKLRHILDDYHENMLRAGRNPGELLLQLLLSTLGIGLLMAVAVCVVRAFGIAAPAWPLLLTIAYLLYMSASYNPLPGASGAQEGGFLLFFGSVYASGQISLAMLLWRFFSYYLSLLLGGAALLIRSLCSLLVKKNS